MTSKFNDYEEINVYLHSKLGYFSEPDGFDGDSVTTEELQEARALLSAFKEDHQEDEAICQQWIENIEQDIRFQQASSSINSQRTIYPEESASALSIPESNLSLPEQYFVDLYVEPSSCISKTPGIVFFF